MAQQPITNGNIRQKIREAQISGEIISGWDVSKVTDMSRLFSSVRWNNFNQDLSAWDVSSVTNMREMFSGCRAFNQDLSAWNVSNVTDMSKMFQLCQAFNQPLNWNVRVSNVTNMSNMFSGCSAFNQDLSAWNVSNVTDMSNMFFACIAFNNNSLNNWNVSNVTNMSFMFSGCSLFNQPLNWNVSNVTDMCFMFSGCSAFNQPLNWNVTSVRDMNFMFSGCSAFNQDLHEWDVRNVTNMRFMFNMCGNLRQDTVFQQGINPSSIGMNNPQVAQVAPVAPVAPVAEHTSVAFEIHNAFAKCASIREKYLEIIGQPHDFPDDADFQAFVQNAFITNINALFTKKDKDEKLANFETVFTKVRGSLSTSTSTFKQLIAKSIGFVFSQGNEEFQEFQKQYIITFLDETTNAYAARCVGSDTTSCVKGILERFVTAVGAASQIICSGGSCNETFKKLDVLFYKDEFIENLSSQWWEKEATKEEIINMKPIERKANFIKYIEDEMRRLNVYNEDDLSKIQKCANNIDYAFERLVLGGRSGKTRKSKKSKKTKKSKKSKKTKKSKKSKKSKKTKKSKKSKK
jgi:surface protein